MKDLDQMDYLNNISFYSKKKTARGVSSSLGPRVREERCGSVTLASEDGGLQFI